ncbi:MAG: hypothetical protein ACI3XQ_07815 [Eubacteriales bacterium]
MKKQYFAPDCKAITVIPGDIIASSGLPAFDFSDDISNDIFKD